MPFVLPYNRSPLLQQLLQQNMVQSGGPQSGIGSLASILAAVLAAKGISGANAADKAQTLGLADSLSRQITPQKPTLVEALQGPVGTMEKIGSVPSQPYSTLRNQLSNLDQGSLQGLQGQLIMKSLTPPPPPEFDFSTMIDPQGKQVRIATNKADLGTSTIYQGGVKPPDTNVSSVVNVGGKKFEEGIGAGAAEAFAKEYDAATISSQALPMVDRALELLDAGIVSGSGAEERLAMARGLKTIGIYDGDVTNTDEYLNLTGRFVAEEIQKLGAGTGLSDADREFARKMAGNEIAINAESLKLILGISKKARLNKIDYYNKRRESLGTESGLVLKLFPAIEMPKQPTPEEERRKRAGL